MNPTTSNPSTTSSSCSSGKQHSASNNKSGFASAEAYLRSILIHPIGLLLASILNEVPLPSTLYDCWNGLIKVKELLIYKGCNDRDDILSSAMSEWTSKREVDLTSKIFQHVDEKIKKNMLDGYGSGATSLLTIEKEEPVAGGKGKVDFIISKKVGDEHPYKKSVVMIVEFGLHHDIWWQKFGQILEYVTLIRTTTEAKYVIDQPVLLTIVTVSSDTSNSRSSNNNDLVARYGMFLCLPKDKNQYRLALLWRVDTFSVVEASKQFGKTLYAAQRCVDVREIMISDFVTSYQYLGPNCCRIGQHLYRCYDNRLRPTERRPDLYEKNSDVFGICNQILSIQDTNRNDTPRLHFGQTLPEGILAIDWLFLYRGQLKIIVTQFHIGVHYATRPEHFLPILDHLEALHNKNYVHGDIRAYNMVLNYDNPHNLFGKLIDFDYGGEVVPVENAFVYPKYPSGYVQQLFDGLRQGRPGENITFEHDWRALGSVILELYQLVPGLMGTEMYEIQLSRMRMAFLDWDNTKSLDLMQNAFTTLEEKQCIITPSKNPGAFLRWYVNLAQQNQFELQTTRNFQLNLEDCNMMKSGTP